MIYSSHFYQIKECELLLSIDMKTKPLIVDFSQCEMGMKNLDHFTSMVKKKKKKKKKKKMKSYRKSKLPKITELKSNEEEYVTLTRV